MRDRRGSAGVLSAVASVVSALASSACCWLPLLLVAFGGSSIGLAVTLGRFRPLFLIVAAAMLALGFYLNYLRQPRCESDGSCKTIDPILRRLNRSILWISMLLVLAFGLFPNYIGRIVGGDSTPMENDSAQSAGILQIGVEGMTCAGCEGTVESALASVAGVLGVKADHAAGIARIHFNPETPPSHAELQEAVRATGYRPSEDAYRKAN